MGRPLAGGVLGADEYDGYRAAHRRIAGAVIERFVDAKALAAAARLLDIAVDGGTGRVMLKSAYEEPPLLDFAMCDVRTDGATAVESFVKDGGGSNGGDGGDAGDDDGDYAEPLLRALESSSTSLYEVVKRSPDGATAELADLLDGGRLTVTDRALSLGGPAPVAAFLRVLRLGDLNMTSGMALAFPGAAAPTVISKYEAIAKRSKRRPEIVRFASFFRLHRLYGMAARYALPPPPSPTAAGAAAAP